ncbi:MAG: hypothetical protein KGL64_02965 [Acidobacteriota bacterium]|nr:hypothetical protein [Acidobacteriota bacterium]
MPAQTVWQMQESGATAGLRGIDSVNGTVAWASGTGGTVLRTIDVGAHWTRCATPDADKDGATMDFRGVQAWDAQTAIVMASGPGDKSRLYKTEDGCRTWTLVLRNTDPDGFYDAVVFWDRKHGILLGDPVTQIPVWQEAGGDPPRPIAAHLVARKLQHKRFLSITTSDGGTTWGYWGTDRGYFTENAATDAAAFAASNSSVFAPMQTNEPCGELLAMETNRIWFGVGGNGGARVLIGMHIPVDVCPEAPEESQATRFGWSMPRIVPIAGGTDSSGVFSLAFRHEVLSRESKVGHRPSPFADINGYTHGVAVGGDFSKPNSSNGTAAWSSDSGWTWIASTTPPHGYRSAVQWSSSLNAWITVGTNGSDISRDDGRTWQPLDNGNWNALSLPFVVGPQGRIARLNPATVLLSSPQPH